MFESTPSTRVVVHHRSTAGLHSQNRSSARRSQYNTRICHAKRARYLLYHLPSDQALLRCLVVLRYDASAQTEDTCLVVSVCQADGKQALKIIEAM